jgi:hypothetical protein
MLRSYFTMLCHKCEGIDFRFVDELPQSQQQKLQSVWFGSVYDYWQKPDSKSYYYHMLHDAFDELALSVDQGCHLCNVIYMALITRKMEAANVPAGASRHLPVVLRSWGSKQRRTFTNSILASSSRDLTLRNITVTYNGFNIELGLRKGLNGLPSVQ